MVRKLILCLYLIAIYSLLLCLNNVSAELKLLGSLTTTLENTIKALPGGGYTPISYLNTLGGLLDKALSLVLKIIGL